ncbi:Homeodomain-containing protein [Artemisia annua]|uniref:Homeodomain-containing protein n=1 Tax=Artemisia annua TaxID=35608 RepID=A0A2U1MT02_ARTAN|nr:Homeodomain-containing protein [Artemisia annua]
MGTRERNSTNYNNPPQSNQDSSPRLSTAATLISSPTSNTRRNETQDHPHLHLHHGNHHHGFKLQKEQLEAQRSRRNPNLDSDPFMPGGEDDTPEALKCAACECHRSFHRREVEGESQSGYHTQHMASRIPLTHNPPPQAAPVPTPPAPSSQQQHHRYHHPMPPIMMAFGGANGAPAESSSEDLNIFRTYAGVQLMAQTSKKRFRTKFTEEQKEKMHDFAERIGWKMQKQDEQEVLQFCNEVGLKRQVFKVWMHNNKQATKKKQL